jgi:hypothetical protein
LFGDGLEGDLCCTREGDCSGASKFEGTSAFEAATTGASTAAGGSLGFAGEASTTGAFRGDGFTGDFRAAPGDLLFRRDDCLEGEVILGLCGVLGGTAKAGCGGGAKARVAGRLAFFANAAGGGLLARMFWLAGAKSSSSTSISRRRIPAMATEVALSR